MNTKLKKEMKMGRIAGPFNMPPFKKIRVSPLAVIPKSTPGEYRLIHNLSAPLGKSVNSFIPLEAFSSAIHWNLPQKIKDGHIAHIIDDFLMLGETGSNDCKKRFAVTCRFMF